MLRAIAVALGLVFAATAAFAQGGKVTVVTSFSKDVTDPIKKAFEKAVPGTTLEVQNRNTNAGVKFLEETKGNNQVEVDLFWASAPDAFEVLKGLALTIRVGDTVPASKAAYRLRDVGEVRELLGALAEGATAGSRV